MKPKPHITKVEYGHKLNRRTCDYVGLPILGSKAKAATKAVKEFLGLDAGWVYFSDGTCYRVTFNSVYPVYEQ